MPGDERIPVPPERWMFARFEGGTRARQPGRRVRGGRRRTCTFTSRTASSPGWIYELVYEGRDPLVLGLGHVAVRDFVSFLKSGQADAAGTPNPARAVGIEKAYGWGRSQTGRCIRDFIHRGFNADAAGGKVFDGLLPHVAGAGLMWMNHRFANVIVAGRPAVRGPRQPGRPLPVLLRAIDRPHHRQDRRHPASGPRPTR